LTTSFKLEFTETNLLPQQT